MLREIVSKTLTGRGKISYFYERELSLNEEVSKTLGCWIINLNYEVKHEKSDVFLSKKATVGIIVSEYSFCAT